MTTAEVIQALGRVAYRFNNEAELQEGIGIALARAGIAHSREVVLTKRDRIDFLLSDGVGIEVKIDGSISALTRQLFRYAELPRITALVVVVGKNTLGNLPPAIKGKALQVVRITRAFA
jgi:hypothetical protein